MHLVDCLFCKVVAGAIPAHKIFEDAQTLAFLDIAPGATGHCLIIPKVHAEGIFDVPSEVWAALMESSRVVAIRLREALPCDGINLVQNSGKAAFQSVFHVHIHLLPRYAGDDLKLPWAPKIADHGALAALAAQIRK
jgi:histidine triad (HIT) family protein